MKKSIILAALLFSVSLFNADGAVLVTNFGNSTMTVSFSDYTSSNQTTSQISLVGIEGNQLFGDLVSTVDISSALNYVTVTGIYTGTSTASFNVELFDVDGDSRLYTGFYTGFTPSVSSTVTAPYVSSVGTFNGIAISFGFTAGGSGSDSSNITLTDLSATAVPEPATWALLAGSLTTVMIFRRRRSKF